MRSNTAMVNLEESAHRVEELSRFTVIGKKLDSVDTVLNQLYQILFRIEAQSLNDCSRGKEIDGSSTIPLLHSPSGYGYDQSGHHMESRGIQNALENREGLLKKVLMPIFDGRLPFS